MAQVRKNKQAVAYILAASHSGSTLLALLLDSHPEICSVGELKVGALGDLDNYLCSCRRKLLECPFWSNVREDMHEAGEEFELNNPRTDIRAVQHPILRKLLRPMVRGRFLEFVRDAMLWFVPAWHRHFRNIKRRNRAFLSALARLSGASVVADSSKVGVRLKYLMRDEQIDVRVIRLVRDGRGVALTYVDPSEFADAKTAELRGGGTGKSDTHAKLDMTEAAYEWARANTEAEALKGRLNSNQYLEIHYEDLCSNTEHTLNTVYRFLNVAESASEVIENIDKIEHHIVGNGMRLDADHTIVLDERWREQLSAEQLEEFDKVAGALNAKYGYR